MKTNKWCLGFFGLILMVAVGCGTTVGPDGSRTSGILMPQRKVLDQSGAPVDNSRIAVAAVNAGGMDNNTAILALANNPDPQARDQAERLLGKSIDAQAEMWGGLGGRGAGQMMIGRGNMVVLNGIAMNKNPYSAIVTACSSGTDIQVAAVTIPARSYSWIRMRPGKYDFYFFRQTMVDGKMVMIDQSKILGFEVFEKDMAQARPDGMTTINCNFIVNAAQTER
ncbi:MAG: hypothetical protein WCL61_03265 [bacterium]